MTEYKYNRWVSAFARDLRRGLHDDIGHPPSEREVGFKTAVAVTYYESAADTSVSRVTLNHWTNDLGLSIRNPMVITKTRVAKDGTTTQEEPDEVFSQSARASLSWTRLVDGQTRDFRLRLHHAWKLFQERQLQNINPAYEEIFTEIGPYLEQQERAEKMRELGVEVTLSYMQ